MNHGGWTGADVITDEVLDAELAAMGYERGALITWAMAAIRPRWAGGAAPEAYVWHAMLDDDWVAACGVPVPAPSLKAASAELRPRDLKCRACVRLVHAHLDRLADHSGSW